MAAKVKQLDGNGTAAAFVAAVFVLNWVCAEVTGYPFAWCWGKQLLQPVLEPWVFVIHFMALAYFAACAWTMEAIKAVKGLMVVVVIFGLPTFTEIMFRHGKSCPSGIVPTMSMPMFGGVP
ncbi:hypothetical protein ABIB06_006525 [Bradyrhizobium sp. LB8.2]|uniref:hypothetical protein n=1 Tax=unclassified Bradyrhizobium TaxID=2631580 RepID=UPI003395076E